MLVLTRRKNEEIVINDNIRISIVDIKGDRIRIGISAPKNVIVDRAEIHDRRTMVDMNLPKNGHEQDTGIHEEYTIVVPRDTQLSLK